MPASVPYAGQVSLPIDQRFGARPHVLLYGAVPDARLVNVSMSAGSNIITSGAAPFLAKHVGRTAVLLASGSGVDVASPSTPGMAAPTVGTITEYISATQVRVSWTAGSAYVNARFAWGTDNADAFDAAIAAIEEGGNALYIDGGMYLTTRTIRIRGNMKLYGSCLRMDEPTNFDDQLLAGRASAILSTANPIMEVYPYPGVELRSIHLHGLGTSTSVETWEQASFSGQIGLWAGNVDKPLPTIATGDDYSYGGSGGLYAYNLIISRTSGWGIYCYKLWGLSTFADLMVWGCGYQGGSSSTYHGGIAIMGECAELAFTRVHIAGPSMGIGIKLGAKKADIDARNRFYLVHTHSKFHGIHMESFGDVLPASGYHVRDYGSIEAVWENCMFGGRYLYGIEIGQEPLYSGDMSSCVFHNCRSYIKQPSIYKVAIKSSEVTITNWHHEGSRYPAEFSYWYGCPVITGKNIVLKPSGDKSALYGDSNVTVTNKPLCITDVPAFDFNLAPDFDDLTAWTITGTATVKNSYEIFAYGGGTATLSLTGLTPNQVHTFGFRHENTFGADLFSSSFRLYEEGGATVISNKLGFEPTASGSVVWVMIHFVTPASGNLKIELKNTDGNTVTFSAPYVGFGPASAITLHDWALMLNPNATQFGAFPQNAPVIAVSTRQKNRSIGYHDHVARAISNYHVSLLSSTADRGGSNDRVGVGFNVNRSDSKWTIATNLTENGAAAILTNPQTGNLDFYTIDSLHDGTTRRLNDSELEANRTFNLAQNRAVLLGTDGSESNLGIQKRGTLDADNLLWNISHRPDGKNLIVYATDGTDFWNLIRTQVASSIGDSSVLIQQARIDREGQLYPNGEFFNAAITAISGSPEGSVFLDKGSICLDTANGKVWRKTTGIGSATGWIDMSNTLPTGTAGRFLRAEDATNVVWAKVDLSNTANVQFTGATAGHPVKAKTGGAIETGPLTIDNPAHVVSGLPDNWLLTTSAGGISAFSPSGAASLILGSGGVIGIISGLAGFDLTTLNTVFTSISAALDALNARCDGIDTAIDDINTALAGKADVGHDHAGVYSEIGHGHSGTTSSGGDPAHTHGWST